MGDLPHSLFLVPRCLESTSTRRFAPGGSGKPLTRVFLGWRRTLRRPELPQENCAMPATLSRSMLPGVIALALAATAHAQTKLTSPQQHFGHEIGTDYVLPDYTQFMAYWQTLARESDRMVLDTIGTTAEGRPQLMAVVTSPANHQRLDRYKEIARRLALADGVSDEEARRLAAEGKAVVWIDGGLHATEVLGAQQLTETVWQLVSGTDPETMRFLDDVIV